MSADKNQPRPTLDSIQAPVAPEPDARSESEAKKLDLAAQENKIELLKAQVAGIKQDISERKVYANKIFVLISAWLIGVFVVILLCGMKCKCFTLSDSVILALIGGTTISVLGLFVIVANYLFPKRPDL